MTQGPPSGTLLPKDELRIEVVSVYDSDSEPTHTYRIYDRDALVYASPRDFSSHKEARLSARQQRNWLTKRKAR